MKRSVCLALSLSLLPALAPPSAAQAPPTEFLQVVTVNVKPEAIADYEDYVKKIVAATGKTTGSPRVVGYQVVLGGPGATYFFVLPFNKWAEIDGWSSIPRILTAAYGEAEAARILQAGRAATARSESAVYRLLPDLSTRPRTFDPPRAYALLVRTEVEPAMQRAYEEYLAKLRAAQEQTPESPTAIRRVSVLGPAVTYVTAQFFSKHAERDAWPSAGDVLRKAHGEAEGRRITEESLRAVRRRDIFVMAHRPDLSVLTPSPAG